MSRKDNQKMWFGHVEAYKSFSGTQKAFCETHHLKQASFSYWLRKYSGRETEVGFVEIKQPSEFCAVDFEVYVGPSRIKFNDAVCLDDIFDFLLKLKTYA